jgi:hypothetical protein
MRKIVVIATIAIIVCLSVAAAPAILSALLSLWASHRTAQVEGFYQEHRFFSELRAAQANSTDDSGPAREVLLQILPLGTDREAAVALLRREEFYCQTMPEPITDTRLRKRFLAARGLTNIPNDGRTRNDFVDCQVTTPNFVGYKKWIVDLEFDADGRLSDAGVAILNISL